MLTEKEAVALLTAVPAVKSVEVAQLRPDDVLVVQCDGPFSLESAERLREAMLLVWPNHKIAILDGSMSLRVLRAANAPREGLSCPNAVGEPGLQGSPGDPAQRGV